jgi:aspartyl aminopeptidase
MGASEPTNALDDLVAFLDACPTPYHVVAEAKRRLSSRGYQEIDERDEWTLAPGDRRFVIRSGGTIVAFRLGAAPPSRAGFRILGAHTDSPNLRIKPIGDRTSKGHRQISIEPYGGVLLHTWMDRDLSVAGRVSLLDGSSHLVDLRDPICRIPNLAIHLYPTLATEGLQLNAQTHLAPTLGLAADEASGVLDLVARKLDASGASGAGRDDIAGFDLCLYDVQGARIGGADREMLFAARIDNLASCHAILTALLDEEAPSDATHVVVLNDHEEVGSQSTAGAKSRLLLGVLERIARSYADRGSDAEHRAFARSMLISVDMAHAVHPNYAERHDPDHLPQLGKGPVIKINANQAYATDGPGAAAFEGACREAGGAAQRFVSRNDYRCGSTIGPITAASTAIRAVDVGSPMLSMHSCREMCGTRDVPTMIRFLSVMLARSDVPAPAD